MTWRGWQEFAERHQIALVGVSSHSKLEWASAKFGGDPTPDDFHAEARFVQQQSPLGSACGLPHGVRSCLCGGLVCLGAPDEW